MPVFEQGYQHWQGQLAGPRWAWLTVTWHGVRAQFRGIWIKLVLALSLGPALGLASAMIAWGLFEQKAAILQPIINALSNLPEELKAGPQNFRVTVWTLAFFAYFQVQLFFSMLLVTFVGPNLISQDLRFNAMPLYFSRPLRRVDYFAGKLGVIGVYLVAVSVAPAALAYLLGVAFSLDPTVIRDTWRLGLASITYGFVVVVSAGGLMLAFSSLSRNSRVVAALWVGLWLVSNSVAGVLTATIRARWCPLVSYTQNLGRLSRYLLGTDQAFRQIGALFGAKEGNGAMKQLIDPWPWYWSAGVLLAVLGLSIWVLTSRVKSLDRLR